MKIKLSKSQWELIGKKTGWMKKADHFVSDCCSAPADGLHMDHGICPDCKDYCEFIDLDEEDEDMSNEEQQKRHQEVFDKLYAKFNDDPQVLKVIDEMRLQYNQKYNISKKN